jgi:small subunit ribosomal protein S17
LIFFQSILWKYSSTATSDIVESSSTAANPEDDYAVEIDDILEEAKLRKIRRGALIGIVTSDKMQKTINITVDRQRYHSKYDKMQNYTKKFMAHDELEVCDMGDLVRIVPCRPLSKNKHFKLLDILRKGKRLDLDGVTRDPDVFTDKNRFQSYDRKAQ